MIKSDFLGMLIIVQFWTTYFFIPGPIFTLESIRDCEVGNSYEEKGYVKYELFPIVYSFDSNVPDLIIEGTVRAFEVWDNLVSFDLFERNSINVSITIKYESVKDTEVIGSTVAVESTNWTIPASIIIFNSDNKFEFDDLPFSCKVDFFPSVLDITSVALHEIGHVLGLGHVSEYTSTMATGYWGSFQKTLTQGDIEGFYEIYGSIDPSFIDER